MGGKHGREGFVSRMLCCPGPGTLSHFVPSGAQGGLAVKLLSGSGVFFLSDSQKGGEATRPFCARESVFSWQDGGSFSTFGLRVSDRKLAGTAMAAARAPSLTRRRALHCALRTRRSCLPILPPRLPLREALFPTYFVAADAEQDSRGRSHHFLGVGPASNPGLTPAPNHEPQNMPESPCHRSSPSGEARRVG